MKQKSAKMLVIRKKNTAPYYKENGSKINVISIIFMRFFFSQANLVFTNHVNVY